MQFDKTRIAVRERSVVDTLDLALHVFRVFAWPLIVTMSIGAFPLAVLNSYLIGWMNPIEPDVPVSAEQVGGLFRYAWTMFLLVVIEAPLASVFSSAYLGQAVFFEKLEIWRIIREVVALFPRLAWCHLLLRGVLPALLLAWATDRNADYTTTELLLMLLFLALMLRRVTTPFLNEIILLERNPLRATNPNAMTIRKRSMMLHGASSGNLVYLAVAASFFALLLVSGLFGVFVCAQGLFLDDWSVGRGMWSFGLPLAMWLTATFFVVVRFLSYLDLRIRREGWEVELRMRAEGSRLTGAKS